VEKKARRGARRGARRVERLKKTRKDKT